MAAIKIVYVIPSLDAGGAERFTIDMLSNLDRSRFAPELLLFAHGGFFLENAKAAGIPVTILNKRWKIDPINFWKLYKALKMMAPDIVHTSLGGDIYGRLAARMLGIKLIVSTEQNVNPDEAWWMRLIKRFTARFARAIVVISEAVRADAKKRYHIPDERLIKIYNGISAERFSLCQPHQERTAIEGGSVGRLVPQKNYSLLLRALALVPELPIKIKIIGEGGLRGELESLAASLGVADRVSFPGPSADVPGFLQTLDFFILTSSWEGLGNVILEAGLCGLPVISSRVDGPAEIIKDGESGLLFHNGIVTDLADKLKLLVEMHKSGADRRLGEALRERVLKDFEIKVVTKRYEELYESLLASFPPKVAVEQIV
jgi:glycosyltransferase involved in cell wall biosynthesis